MRYSILILEDDLAFSMMLTTWLRKKGFDVEAYSSLAEAGKMIEKQEYDLILSDFRLPDGTGLDFLSRIKSNNSETPVIMMTSYSDIPTAVKAIKNGASDYITKPLNPEDLLIKIKEIIPGPIHDISVKKEISSASVYLEGQSLVSKQLFEYVRLVAPTDMSVLITGASGTGKEFVAHRIHELSKRSDQLFVALDCGSLSKELAVSEFFGHIKGAFTGAVADKEGAFVTAKGGTVFLDEIGNLSYDVQVQLLRALQEKKVKPLGGVKELDIDIRLVAATNENLYDAIAKGRFREDLFHRINEFTIQMPALHERDEDILLFANHFLELSNKELNKETVGFDEETISFIQTYKWPGNLRQMKNTIRYANLITTSRYITPADFPKDVVESQEKLREIPQLKNADNERSLIEKALKQTNNNKAKAARLLGIDRKTLYNKLKIYKLE